MKLNTKVKIEYDATETLNNEEAIKNAKLIFGNEELYNKFKQNLIDHIINVLTLNDKRVNSCNIEVDGELVEE